jgi:hypothetical protein
MGYGIWDMGYDVMVMVMVMVMGHSLNGFFQFPFTQISLCGWAVGCGLGWAGLGYVQIPFFLHSRLQTPDSRLTDRSAWPGTGNFFLAM